MDSKEHLQTLITSLINGDDKAAQAAVHQIVVQKSQEIAQRPPETPQSQD